MSKFAYAYLALVLLLLTSFIFYRVYNSRIGLTFRAIRDADILAECLGINIMRYKVYAFVMASFFAALAGGIFAPYMRTVHPDYFSIWVSTDASIYAIIGGLGSFWGPIVGASLLIPLVELLLSGAAQYKALLFGTLLIMTIITQPEGIIGLVRRISPVRERLLKSRQG